MALFLIPLKDCVNLGSSYCEPIASSGHYSDTFGTVALRGKTLTHSPIIIKELPDIEPISVLGAGCSGCLKSREVVRIFVDHDRDGLLLAHHHYSVLTGQGKVVKLISAIPIDDHQVANDNGYFELSLDDVHQLISETTN